MANDSCIEVLRRVKSGETWDQDPTKRSLEVFLAVKRPVNTREFVWIQASVIEHGYYTTSSWSCHNEEEAVKWFNVYVELYGPPRRGEFLGFKYGNAKVSETCNVPPMSWGS